MKKTKILVIQTSLNPNANSSKIANYAKSELDKIPYIEVEVLDLRFETLQFCDGRTIDQYSKQTQELDKRLREYDSYILITPIYNHSISGVCKNFLDIHSEAMSEKYVGLIENAGGIHSKGKAYSQVPQMLEFFKINLLEFSVYTNSRSFDNEKLVDEIARSEFEKMKNELIKLLSKHHPNNPIED